jgi:hypothetical protein
MKRVFRTKLERRSSSALEVVRTGASDDSWIVALVVSEQELERHGDAGVLDLLDVAVELRGLIERDRAA